MSQVHLNHAQHDSSQPFSWAPVMLNETILESN